MSEPRQCCHCQKFGNPPEVLPYLGEGRGHYWAHQKCDYDVRLARAKPTPVPELDFATHSEMTR